MASPKAKDNYRRVWARDAVIAGLAGLWSGLEDTTTALRNTLATLASARSELGQIPSNVSASDSGVVSFGTLAGRIDATLWWMVGLLEYVKHSGDRDFLDQHKGTFEAAVRLTRAWELNDRGFMFTPPGGNWADEYPIQGYTLYDQSLRHWAYRLAADCWPGGPWAERAARSEALIESNFSGDPKAGDSSLRYHPMLDRPLRSGPAFWWSAFSPEGYQDRWDLAAHAVALMAGLPVSTDVVEQQLNHLRTSLRHSLPPVFYPIVEPGHLEWERLKANHLYAFKNDPYCFHNGGSWPVWNGLLAYALQMRGALKAAQQLAKAQQSALSRTEPSWTMAEYWRLDQDRPAGQAPLCFTAAGSLLSIDVLLKMV